MDDPIGRTNQGNTRIAGSKLDRPLVAPAIAAEQANAAKKQAVELIRSQLFGRWHWGGRRRSMLDHVAEDGTFAARGPYGMQDQGLWKVEEDGTIRLSDGKNGPAVVKLDLKEDKITIRYAKGSDLTASVATRSDDYGTKRAQSELADLEQTKLIKAKLVGIWSWGPAGQEMKFNQDGTFVDKQTYYHAFSGKWKAYQDGKIRVFYDDKSSAVVTMNADDENKIFVVRWYSGSGGWRGEATKIPGSWNHCIAQLKPTVTSRSNSAESSCAEHSKPRRQAIDNLVSMSRAKCNAPIIAISDPCRRALKDRDKEMQLKAIEAIREIGMPKEGPYPVGAAMAALVQTVLQTADPDLGAAAEDALLKLLPLIGRRLMMDDAILLLEAHESGNPRVAGAVEGAWSACALTKEKVANEPEKRRINNSVMPRIGPRKTRNGGWPDCRLGQS